MKAYYKLIATIFDIYVQIDLFILYLLIINSLKGHFN